MNINPKAGMHISPKDDLKILIADDDIPTRMLLRTAISQWGYKVVEAGDGEEAWKILLNEDPPQILLVDWMMPVMDGIQLCERVRREFLGFSYIILLTQLPGSTNIQQALEAGADEYLSKPFNMIELRNRLLIGTRIITYANILLKQKESLKNISQNTNSLAKLFADVSSKLQSLKEKQQSQQNIDEMLQELNNISNMIEAIKNELSRIN